MPLELAPCSGIRRRQPRRSRHQSGEEEKHCRQELEGGGPADQVAGYSSPSVRGEAGGTGLPLELAPCSGIRRRQPRRSRHQSGEEEKHCRQELEGGGPADQVAGYSSPSVRGEAGGTGLPLELAPCNGIRRRQPRRSRHQSGDEEKHYRQELEGGGPADQVAGYSSPSVRGEAGGTGLPLELAPCSGIRRRQPRRSRHQSGEEEKHCRQELEGGGPADQVVGYSSPSVRGEAGGTGLPLELAPCSGIRRRQPRRSRHQSGEEGNTVDKN